MAPAPPPSTAIRAVAALALAGAAILLAAGAPGLDALRSAAGGLTGDPSLACAYRARTGVDCLGCGGTRAFGHVARGRIAAGFRVNGLGATVGLLTWALLPCAAVVASTGRPRALVLFTAAGGVILAIAFAARALQWWRALPPGFAG